ncbi:hypothetical protein SCORR_v1c05850 [Spiroplasma corruscae]|uniref:Lipoprotein n=1 Tax=Spiroplasma corruscae TaxID=216934 RepID=A0A222EPD7_9MOLU|nr:hypothetical protein [Spiroplasma corruscae]ASP28357.1 hypothetical protein SCORR_v1c05850 [Spiroplasma corruscae]
MKKILSLLSSIGLVTTSSSLSMNVVSCGDSDTSKELTYQDNKKDSDAVEYLTNPLKVGVYNLETKKYEQLSIVDKKLGKDYHDLDSSNIVDGTSIGTFEGSLLNFIDGSFEEGKSLFGDFDTIYKEIADLKATSTKDGENLNVTFYNASIKGNKDDLTFILNIYKVSTKIDKDNKSLGGSMEKVFHKNISLTLS